MYHSAQTIAFHKDTVLMMVDDDTDTTITGVMTGTHFNPTRPYSSSNIHPQEAINVFHLMTGVNLSIFSLRFMDRITIGEHFCEVFRNWLKNSEKAFLDGAGTDGKEVMENVYLHFLTEKQVDKYFLEGRIIPDLYEYIKTTFREKHEARQYLYPYMQLIAFDKELISDKESVNAVLKSKGYDVTIELREGVYVYCRASRDSKMRPGYVTSYDTKGLNRFELHNAKLDELGLEVQVPEFLDYSRWTFGLNNEIIRAALEEQLNKPINEPYRTLLYNYSTLDVAVIESFLSRIDMAEFSESFRVNAAKLDPTWNHDIVFRDIREVFGKSCIKIIGDSGIDAKGVYYRKPGGEKDYSAPYNKAAVGFAMGMINAVLPEELKRDYRLPDTEPFARGEDWSRTSKNEISPGRPASSSPAFAMPFGKPKEGDISDKGD